MIHVYLGQRVVPDHYDPRADAIADADLQKMLNEMQSLISGAVGRLPTHAAQLQEYCAREMA